MPERETLGARRTRESRVLIAGLVGSGILHVALLSLPGASSPEFEGATATRPRQLAGVHLLELVESDVDGTPLETPNPPARSTEPASDAPAIVVRDPAPSAPGRESTSPAPMGSSNLGPSLSDLRLIPENLASVSTETRLFNGLVYAIEESLLSQSGLGPDSLLHDEWSSGSVGLRPGSLQIAGMEIPYCGGADATRCGFGVAPWNRRNADRAAELERMLREQTHHSRIRERAEMIRRRADEARDTLRRWSPSVR